MGFSDKKSEQPLRRGFFESERAFAERVIRNGNRVAGGQYANAKRTIKQMDENRRKEEAKKQASEAKRKQRDEQARISARALADSSRSKKTQQAKRNKLNGWLE